MAELYTGQYAAHAMVLWHIVRDTRSAMSCIGLLSCVVTSQLFSFRVAGYEIAPLDHPSLKYCVIEFYITRVNALLLCSAMLDCCGTPQNCAGLWQVAS